VCPLCPLPNLPSYQQACFPRFCRFGSSQNVSGCQLERELGSKKKRGSHCVLQIPAVPLTARVREMLKRRKAQTDSAWVFAEDAARPMLNSSLDHLHKKLRKLRQVLKLPGDFVLHSLRDTYGTRLGEAGADAFTIMRLMGHSTVTVSQRYVHPTPEAM
jgi:site-specific recombinase XerC